MSKTMPRPEAMKQSGREIVPEFHPEELLFRRIPNSIWDDPDTIPPLAAVQLPDISVGRSRFGHAEWVRFDVVNNRYYKNFGVIGFQVAKIPPVINDNNFFSYQISHVPLEEDYPHSEIRAFENGVHLESRESVLPEENHLEWRCKLLECLKVMIKPREKREIPQDCPSFIS